MRELDEDRRPSAVPVLAASTLPRIEPNREIMLKEEKREILQTSHVFRDKITKRNKLIEFASSARQTSKDKVRSKIVILWSPRQNKQCRNLVGFAWV